MSPNPCKLLTSVRRGSRWAATVLFAGLLGAAHPGDAAASVIFTTTPFSGLTTDFTTVGNQSMPYTDANGRVFNGGGSIGIKGWFIISSETLSFGSLAPNTTMIGLTRGSLSFSAPVTLLSATFSNGDTYTGPQDIPANSFFGFISTTPFTSATVNLSSPNTGTSLADFRSQSSSVPEPPSLALLGMGAVLAVASARRRRSGSAA